MRKRGLEPEIVSLPHNTEGYWLGNKNAKNVLVYYHGMSPRVLVQYRALVTQDLYIIHAKL